MSIFFTWKHSLPVCCVLCFIHSHFFCLVDHVCPDTSQIQAIFLCHWVVFLIFIPHPQSINLHKHTWSQKAWTLSFLCYLITLRARQCGECSFSPPLCLAHVFLHAPSTELYRDMMSLTLASIKVPQTSQEIPQSHSTAGTTLMQSPDTEFEVNSLSNENFQLSLTLPLIGPLWGWSMSLKFVGARWTSASEELWMTLAASSSAKCSITLQTLLQLCLLSLLSRFQLYFSCKFQRLPPSE